VPQFVTTKNESDGVENLVEPWMEQDVNGSTAGTYLLPVYNVSLLGDMGFNWALGRGLSSSCANLEVPAFPTTGIA
jgi:hypothetical protein